MDSVADRHSVSVIRNHPKFDVENGDHDYAILILTSPLTFSAVAAPICLPGDTTSKYTDQVGDTWGIADSHNSQVALRWQKCLIPYTSTLSSLPYLPFFISFHAFQKLTTWHSFLLFLNISLSLDFWWTCLTTWRMAMPHVSLRKPQWLAGEPPAPLALPPQLYKRSMWQWSQTGSATTHTPAELKSKSQVKAIRIYT